MSPDVKPGAATTRRKSPSGPGYSKPTESSTARLAAKVVRKASAATKPLLPLSEGKLYQDRAESRGQSRETEAEKWHVNLDNASAARDGRQFTVANVGNNGRIYLRPSIRRPNQTNQPPPSLNLPLTPPGTSSVSSKPQGTAASHTFPTHTSQWTETPSDSPRLGAITTIPEVPNLDRSRKHRRALSDSTIHEAAGPKATEGATQRVVITDTGGEVRPRTMDDLNAVTEPFLNISIPSWRLGTPRFTMKGTAQLRGSSYAPTEDFRSSRISMINQRPHEMHAARNFSWNRPAGTFMSPEEILTDSIPKSPRPPSPLRLRAMRSAHLSSHPIIEAEMFTELTFRPTCDDRQIVRYSSASGAVTAATPPRLVAEITSPSFLDYELISDFFLTYRAFLDPLDLLRMLFARMRWALSRQDEVGMIVRVRTFVATRHWILNYFADDFALGYDLRKEFCELLNGVVDDLSENPQTRQAQLRVIAELKKCWRRVCAHYWDGPAFDDSLTVESPVAPGGIAGHRDPNLTPGDLDEMENKPQPSPTTCKETARNDVGFSTDPSKTPKLGDFIVLGDRPLTPEDAAPDAHGPQDAGSPHSMASQDVVSCSFHHGKSLKQVVANPSQLWTPHPVPSTAAVQPQHGAVATTPRALVGKRVRPAHSHKRSNSVSDSLREHCSDRPLPNEVDFPTILPSAGSLVRGNILPPGQAYVDISAQDCGGMAHRQTTVFQPPGRRMFRERALGSAMSGSGMRKLLSSVRRALSARGVASSPTHATFTSISPVGPPGAASNRLPGTAVVPQERTVQTGTRPAVRIDLLGAEVAEDFKNAVRDEQGGNGSQPAGVITPPHNHSLFVPSPDNQETNSMDWFRFDDTSRSEYRRPMSDTGITNGSQSIVIVDDTIPFEPPESLRITLGRPQSVETFTDSFMPATGDPTPPNTPPANSSGDTPRRSSYLLNQQVMRPEEESLPPFVPDLTTLEGNTGARMPEEQSRPSLSGSRRAGKYPPLSGGTFRMHRRARSSRTHQSLNSILQRRHTSLSSGIAPPSTIRSFDATTVSGNSVVGDDSDVPVPEPLRVLRRRPGGDLRAANNVDELQGPKLTRTQSVGSLMTYSESVRSSSFFASEPEAVDDDAESDYGEYLPRSRQDVFSLGQLTKQPPKEQPKRDLSLFSTHSSKPNMRPSFEAEAQRLAQISDDEDDGGIECALAKLEGKFSKKSKKDSDPPTEDDEDEEVDMAKLSEALQSLGGGMPEKNASRRIQVDGPSVEDSIEEALEMVVGPDDSVERTPRIEVAEVQSFLSEASRESYNSIPLLNRGLTDDGGSKRSTRVWADRSILRDSDDLTSAEAEKDKGDERNDEQHLSYDFVEKTSSMERIQPGNTAPSPREDDSFLDDESMAETEISSELSTDETTPKTTHEPVFVPPKLQPQPLKEPVTDSMLEPVSPPLSTPRQAKSPTFPSQPPNRPLPPTPEATPTAPQTQTLPSVQSPPDKSAAAATETARSAPEPDATARKYSVHLPFILAFDSDILAQQFTLIEKDALNEIDWKDLIEMNWKNATSSSSRSWVDFLRNTDAHGVEVVIARFNIMVKWAVSEIVLTQNVEERARCIIKMIHIAAHCRRYRNFATLAQLTIALSSNEVSRLSKTWNMVPVHDMRTLADLETLVTPTRNFFNLRAEMETGTDNGCIPFVGIYTHDLLYNAQRPSEIASSPVSAPLVNFERSRIAASVVKVLLRLLESSTHYSFQPLEGITERCLWVGALHDDDIRRHSESLE